MSSYVITLHRQGNFEMFFSNRKIRDKGKGGISFLTVKIVSSTNESCKGTIRSGCLIITVTILIANKLFVNFVAV